MRVEEYRALEAQTKRRKPRLSPEHDLQVAVVKVLHVVMPPRIPWSGVDHAAKLSRRQAGERKARGVKRGLADLRFVLEGGRSAEIELKACRGAQAKDQRDWETAVTATGALYAVCRSLDEALDQLTAWGVKLRGRL